VRIQSLLIGTVPSHCTVYANAVVGYLSWGYERFALVLTARVLGEPDLLWRTLPLSG
jgi:hypothetical protein